MLSNILAAFKRAEVSVEANVKRTVSEVMSVFHSAIQELAEVERQHTEDAATYENYAAQAALSADEARQEAAYAREVMDKLLAIVKKPANVS